jgi:hypothetical protein
VQNWWAQNDSKYQITTLSDKPTATDDVHVDAFKPVVSIIEPNNTETYPADKKINLKISSSSHFPLTKIDIFINDNYLGTAPAPFSFSFTPSELQNLQTNNELKIIAYDSVYNTSETTSNFSVTQ